MRRRDFMKTAVAAVAGAPAVLARPPGPHVMTVAGPVPASELGVVLPHEHIMVDFIGADRVSPDRYDRHTVAEVARPHLARARELGVRTLVECTPAYLARDAVLLARLASESGLHIVTNTGYYGAANDTFLPAHAFTEDADALAARWVGEWRDGIEGTGIRPGFIKIGVDPGPLSDVDAKLVRAACRVHRATGLTMASHTTDSIAARASLAILDEEGIPPSAFIWVHAQAEQDRRSHVEAARRGAWVEFDGLASESVEQHVALVVAMKEAGCLDRVLVSHDAGWYHVGEPGGGAYRGYETLCEAFLPALARAGLGQEEITLITEINPAKALALDAV